MAYSNFGDSRYTLKNLLEIPELQHPPILNGHLDSKKTGVSSGYGIPSAFLGPTNLWNNANQIGGQENGEFSLQYMDLDEFLSENGIPSSELNTVNNQCVQTPQEPKLAVPPSENYIQLQTPPTPQALSPGQPPKRTSPKNSPRQVYEDVHETSAPTFYSNEDLRSPSSPFYSNEDPRRPSSPFYSNEDLRRPSSPYNCAESSNGSSVSSQSINQSCSNDPSAQPVIPDSRHSARRGDISQASPHHPNGQVSPISSPDHPSSCHNAEYELNPSDLALASVPGQENFDPRKCKFSDEELKPQPIIRKSRKIFVPDACKDERYWMRRNKNNIAAKRSREARRIKENQIALRAAFLEKENNALKDEVNKIKEENVNLQKKLSQYEQVGN